MNMQVHIFPVTDTGLKVARKIEAGLKDSRLYRPTELKAGGLKKRVKDAFKGGAGGLVFVSAVGVSVRTVAPYLKDKLTDPAVVTVDEAGRFAVSLVSGHMGGANELARKVARLIGATPVITTATDIRGLPCIEDVAKRFSLRIDNRDTIKLVNSAILKGDKVVVVDRDPERLRALKGDFGHAGAFRFQKTVPKNPDKGASLVIITARLDEKLPRMVSRKTLFLRPPEFVVGMGFKKGVTVKEFERALTGVLRGHKLSPLSVRNLATIDIKRTDRGLRGFSKSTGMPVDFFSREELSEVKPPSGPSRFVRETVGVNGVAEPAAMVSRGGGAGVGAGVKRIWIKKQKRGNITIAVAKVPFKEQGLW